VSVPAAIGAGAAAWQASVRSGGGDAQLLSKRASAVAAPAQ